jgi:SAM-dependent methyltransferase
VAATLAATLIFAGIIGGLLWWPATVLVLPGLAAAWVTFMLTQIRSQLSSTGGGWERRIHEFVADRLSLEPGSAGRVLDIGCGEAGLITILLTRATQLDVTGVDLWSSNWEYSQASCESRIRALGLHAAFLRMDAAGLEFPDDTFDAVASVMCFHEVQAPAGTQQRGPILAVQEALRVLKPGGRFVLVDRFTDRRIYGPHEALQAVLRDTTDLTTESLVTALDVPWPLNSPPSLGHVLAISGTKAGLR